MRFIFFDASRLPIVCSFLLSGFFLYSNASAQIIRDTLQVQLLNSSTLLLDGKTNINTFQCGLSQEFETLTMTIPAVRNQNVIDLKKADIPILIAGFDCGKKKITNDLKKTLRYQEYPNIILSFNKISYSILETLSENLPLVLAELSITIGDITNKYKIEFKNVSLDGDVLSFFGQQQLLMSDYELNPPSPLFGAIKVKDEIDVEFFLALRFL